MNDLNKPVITLKPKREKPVLGRHPWIFSGAIRSVSGDITPGQLVRVEAHDGRFLAQAYYNHHSQIEARILSWSEDEIDEQFWRDLMAQAIDFRSSLALEPETNAYRIIYGESDGLPGLVVDKYGSYLVLQALTTGIAARKQMIVQLLLSLGEERQWEIKGIIERSDVAIRKKEGLEEVKGILWGVAPPDSFAIEENGRKFLVDLMNGHKTGHYLDQRENRALVCQPKLVAGKNVLNLFSYTGGFGVYAAINGAKSVVNVDSSVEALELAEENIKQNGYAKPGHEYIAADVFEILRHFRDTNRQFDMIILDPPKFVLNRSKLNQATRGYKDLNWLAMRLLRPNGLLATFSCSGLLSEDLFQKILFGAALDAERNAQIIHRLGQGMDHPVALNFPESAYLKGFLCRIF